MGTKASGIRVVNVRGLMLVMAIAALAVVGAACGGDGGGSGGSDVFAGIDQDFINTLTGSTTTTEQIVIKEGLLLMHAESDGGHFAINIVQDTGNELMFNETVEYSGSNAVRIFDYENRIGLYLEPGLATMEITSSTDWSVSFSQEKPSTGLSSSLEISGTFDYVVPAIDFKQGSYTLTASSDEEFGNFSIVLVNLFDSGHQLVVNESNPQDKTFEFEINEADFVVNPAGLWAMVIQSPGDWEVKIE
ncbi:hypothetical protein JYU04_01910 [Dehalococcoides mccartyi]|nr:hypothetical protein [Dehalococcoides mccartyi]